MQTKKPNATVPVDVDEVDEMEMDSVNLTVVKTVNETRQPYVTLIPQSSSIENIQFANPPDSPINISCKPESKKACREVITTCKNMNQSSSPAYSLITFHRNKSEINTPTTHIAMNVTPQTLKNGKQEIIPKNFLFIYELLLTETNFHDFVDVIPSLLAWASKRNTTCLLSLPAALKDRLQQAVNDTPLQEVTRPFQDLASGWPPE